MGPAEEVLVVVAIDPIKNVEESVKSEACNIVRCKILNFTHSVEHHDLRYEGNRFKPD